MLRGLTKTAVAAIVAIGVGYPISQQLWARAAIQHTMINSLDANDNAALQQWPGSAESFVAMLYDRCMRAHSGDTVACTRYQMTN
jgi:hypothetical protein